MEKEVLVISIITVFVLSFMVPAAVVTTAFRVEVKRTIERIEIASARAIVGHAKRGQKPREVGSRSWFLVTAETAKQNSGIIGK